MRMNARMMTSGALRFARVTPVLLAAVCVACGCSATGAGRTDDGGAPPMRLSVSGQEILDPSGTPIVLRGWNWGQWGTMQPQDAADNRAQGANVVRIPLRWWGAWGEDSVNA